jgi:ectoine hydroxylase-related dioxygenase (phytanoyl-CoA dioxygenase family)
MSWIVDVSPGEASRAEFSRETEAAAYAAVHQHGCVVMRGAFSPAVIEGMHREYLAQFGGLDTAAMAAAASKPPPNRFLEVGNARFDILLRMTGAFARPEIFANSRLLKLLRALLEDELQLSNYTAVIAHPGAAQQHAHRDHGQLFARTSVGPKLPIYAINTAVPLVDVDMEMGPTGVWLGSHRWETDRTPKAEPIAAVPLRRGDCMMLDYRTMHAGLANRSSRPRPIVYMVYALPWFFDQINHLRRIPIDMPLDLFKQYPSLRPLLSRALSYAVMRTWREETADAVALPLAATAEAAADHAQAQPNLGDVSGRGKIGRNDPCPCGSGKKYKQCHGRLA